MESYDKDIEKLSNEFYDKLIELYGEKYKWIGIEVKMLEEKPQEGLTLTINPDERNIWKEWKDIRENHSYKENEGPKVENSGSMWDKSKFEKINS